jgi:two-component system chemotaxis response regulator CheY
MNQTKTPRVLIADDEKHIRMLLKSIITKMSYEVVGEATNGQEAVDLFKRHRPDLVLLDINMPFKRGEEALEEILSQFPDASIIMLTSVAGQGSVERCIDLGASNYIRKDTPVTEIAKIIEDTWDMSH